MDRKNNLVKMLVGIITGLCNGLFGGGGGMVVVPLLEFWLKVSNKKAHATAILIILPISIISGITYVILNGFNFKAGIPTGVGVVVGGIIGAIALSKIKSKYIVVIFSVLMLIAGIKMVMF